MLRSANKKVVSIGLVLSFFLFTSPYILTAKSGNKGNLIGFVFAEDGTTPLESAVVTILNVSDGNRYASSKTDGNGVFKLENLEKGIYILGVSTEEGDFNSNNLVGIEEARTGKVSIYLSKYDAETQIAAKQIVDDQRRKGESLIGRIESYNGSDGMAAVYIIKGFLQQNDRIHVLGVKDVSDTDFYQNSRVMNFENKSIKRAFAGQTIFLSLTKPARQGDLVYLVCKGPLPIFLIPLGLAAIVGGVVVTGGGEEELSQFKK